MKNAPTSLVSEDQARKLVDQITLGMVEAIVGSSLPSDRLQKILEQEDHLHLRSRFVKFLHDIEAEIVDMVSIRTNYDAPNAIANAIEGNRFDEKYLALKPEQIPIVGSGEVDHEVGEVHFNEHLINRDVIAMIDGRGYRFADPLTTLLYAIKLPDRQGQYPLAVIFEIDGQQWFMILDRGGSGRCVDVVRSGLSVVWPGTYRFLVVRKYK